MGKLLKLLSQSGARNEAEVLREPERPSLSREPPSPADDHRRLIDCHVHMLPGIDDGARDLEQALAMARLAVEDGIAAVILTPHHFNGSYSNDAERIREQVAAFRIELAAAEIPLEVHPGCELHLVPELPEALAAGSALTIADRGKAALIELPVHQIPLGTQQILESCLALGITPLIAHPERNTQLCQDIDILSNWVALGCLAQLTAQSCTGRFGPRIQQAARQMVEGGVIHIVASDGHRPHNRVPAISAGRQIVAEWTNEDTAELLTSVYPSRLVHGERVDTDLLAPPPRRSWWRRFCTW